MAYVVARPRGRFEIRESVHTDKGPRARSLASFSELTDNVVAKARGRATRPFDAEAVRASAARAERDAHARPDATTTTAATRPDMRRFVESTRRMARTLETQPASPGSRRDPGDALIDLLGFVAQISSSRPGRRSGRGRGRGREREREPLQYPPLARVRAAHESAAASP